MMSDYYDLGDYQRPITTASPDAHLWFNRGLIWCYAFNQEEGVRCFRRAAEFDPDCAIAYWGVAYAKGPFYNLLWTDFTASELEDVVVTCHEAAGRALALSGRVSPVEQALIRALTQRYQSDRVVGYDVLQTWIDDYAVAMAEVYATFPEDFDVIALYAEALMTRTPWRLWDVDKGVPAEGADTLEAIAVLERGMRLVEERGAEPHAGMVHMYIHAMEMSPTPEIALPATDALRDLVPDGGHLRHMPSHIDVLCGRYVEAITANDKAIAADKKFLDLAGPHDFYMTSCCHDFHLKMYAAMFAGRFQSALDAADGLAEMLTEDVLRNDQPYTAATLEGYYSMKMHVLVRFGKWREIVDTPLPTDAELYCVTVTMHHYAKGVANAALGNIEAAEREKIAFEAAVANIANDRFFFNNFATDIMDVARAMLDGELAYRKGDYDDAFADLRQAAALSDRLHYTEPWAWMHPPRHALGALLLERGHVEEAERVYAADLGLTDELNRCCQHPGNVWSLHGYVECLRRQQRDAEADAIQPRLDAALATCDVPIGASCCCRGTTLADGRGA